LGQRRRGSAQIPVRKGTKGMRADRLVELLLQTKSPVLDHAAKLLQVREQW